jgi:heat-inducible transcriptional repressor
MLNTRQEIVLKAIIDYYLDHKEPLGSRYLSKFGPLKLSPASIRNIMSDLEYEGYINQPHTSAGRQPTDKGYRYYIDTLISVNILDETFIEDFKNNIKTVNVDDFFNDVCSAVSNLTGSIGFIIEPKISTMQLKHIEFVRLNKNSAIAIIVTSTGIVHNILLQIDEKIKDSELGKISNFLNKNYINKGLFEIKMDIQNQLIKERANVDMLIEKIKNISSDVFNHLDNSDVIMKGTSHILNPLSIKDIEKLQTIFESIEEKSFVYNMINKCINEDVIKIFIGSEIGIDTFKDFSLLTKSFSKDNVIGFLGVLGPKNMKYPSVIPLVNYTTKLITEFLKNYGGNNDEK